MKSYKIIINAVIGILLLMSCADKLEVRPPNSIIDEQITDLMINGDDATVEMIMTAIATPTTKYFNLVGVPTTGSADGRLYSQQGLDYMRNLEGNDIVFGDNNNGLFGMDEYQLSDFIGDERDKNIAYWYCAAAGINQANLLLGYMTAEMAGVKNIYKSGRALGLTIRAYEYMNLMENYQDAFLLGGKDKLGISLYDKYDPQQENKARSSSAETYDFIKKDLNEAVSLLSAAGVGYTTEGSKLEDMDLGVAKFLLARVSLWTGDNATCISACNDIINSGSYSLIKEENYGGRNTGSDWSPANLEVLPQTNAFLSIRKNPEVILGFIRTSSFNYTMHNGWTNPFSTSYGGASRGYARVDNRLYDKISTDDFRKECFKVEEIGDYHYAATNVTARIPSYVNMKFAATHGLAENGNDNTEKNFAGNVEFCKFRLAEVYLMLAEAKLASGDESGAKSTLNELLAARTKSGATTLTCDNYPSMAGMSTLEKIQLQWRIEMWGEGGREFYNNKRWNIAVDRAGSSNHVFITSYPVSKMTLQIPRRELIDNDLSVQN